MSKIFSNIKPQNLVDWNKIIQNNQLSIQTLIKYRKLFNKQTWISISKFQKLSPNFIQKFFNKLDLDSIPKFQKLSPNLYDKFDLKSIIQFQSLSLNFIQKILKNNEIYVLKYQQLTEEFLTNNPYLLTNPNLWKITLKYQKLSSNFLQNIPELTKEKIEFFQLYQSNQFPDYSSNSNIPKIIRLLNNNQIVEILNNYKINTSIIKAYLMLPTQHKYIHNFSQKLIHQSTYECKPNRPFVVSIFKPNQLSIPVSLNLNDLIAIYLDNLNLVTQKFTVNLYQ